MSLRGCMEVCCSPNTVSKFIRFFPKFAALFIVVHIILLILTSKYFLYSMLGIIFKKLMTFLLAHLAFRPCELLSSLFVRRLSSVVRRSSVNISHFNLLLRNHWTNCNQTLVEWSLDGPLSKLCPVIPTSNQDGRQAKWQGVV